MKLRSLLLLMALLLPGVGISETMRPVASPDAGTLERPMPPSASNPAPHEKTSAPTTPPPTVEGSPPALPEPKLLKDTTAPTLCDAVATGDLAFLQKLLEAGMDPNERAADDDTPLAAAIRDGADDMAILLLFHGADPNLPGRDKQPPIALAALRRHLKLFPLMLADGANPNVAFAFPPSNDLASRISDPEFRSEFKRERNITPLMTCAARGDVEAVTVLLNAGAKTEAHTLPHYRYPINFAADQRYLYVMRILLGRKPESEPHVLITVNLTKQKSWLEVDGKLVYKTTISTGRRGYETPAGRYVITNKYKEWVSTIYKVPMPYFLRLNCSAIGLHKGYVTGEPASHGCIRLPEAMAIKYFGVANVGDEVTIEY